MSERKSDMSDLHTRCYCCHSQETCKHLHQPENGGDRASSHLSRHRLYAACSETELTCEHYTVGRDRYKYITRPSSKGVWGRPVGPYMCEIILIVNLCDTSGEQDGLNR